MDEILLGDVGDMGGNMWRIDSDLAATRLFSAPSRVWSLGAGLAGTILDFGRYAGWSIPAIGQQDPDYLETLTARARRITLSGT